MLIQYHERLHTLRFYKNRKESKEDARGWTNPFLVILSVQRSTAEVMLGFRCRRDDWKPTISGCEIELTLKPKRKDKL